jgi:hypothetical protein
MANGYTAEKVVEAIKGSKGFKTVIAKRLGCSYRHAFRLIEKYDSAQEALENEKEGMKDFTEGKLYQKIEAGDTTAIIFYAKTQMKDRGYVERKEVGGTGDDGAIIIRFEGIIGDDHD